MDMYKARFIPDGFVPTGIRRPRGSRASLWSASSPVQSLTENENIERLPPIQRWIELKRLTRLAEKLARNSLTRSPTPLVEARLRTLRSISRAAHCDDARLARVVLARAQNTQNCKSAETQ